MIEYINLSKLNWPQLDQIFPHKEKNISISLITDKKSANIMKILLNQEDLVNENSCQY